MSLLQTTRFPQKTNSALGGGGVRPTVWQHLLSIGKKKLNSNSKLFSQNDNSKICEFHKGQFWAGPD
jgi:hypothetical protein